MSIYIIFATYIGILLIGIFVGMAGEYFALLFTDQRKKQEYKKKLDKKYKDIEEKMPELINEMKEDLSLHPLVREFILNRGLYNSDPNNLIFNYSFSDHEYLKNKVIILEEYGFVKEITYNNVDRYMFLQEFIERLIY